LELWGCKIFNGASEGDIEFGRVEFENGKIIQIESLPEGGIYQKLDGVIDARGCTVLPGFIECEGHLGLDGSPTSNAKMKTESTLDIFITCIKSAARFLEKGVTTVRDLGDKAYETVKFRDEVKAGAFKGPRILAAGMPIRATHGHFVGYEVDGADQARNAVRKAIHNGVDVVKLISSNSKIDKSRNDVGAPELLQDEMRIVCDIAHNFGKKVASHAHSKVAVYNSIMAGVDSVEHGTMLSEEIIDLMVAHKTWLVPTFAAYDIMAGDESLLEPRWRNFAKEVIAVKGPWFRKALDAGVKIAMGTDAGSPLNRHGNVARELSCMVQWGMTPKQALASCTSEAAELLGIEDEVGFLKEGYTADITVVKGDPTHDIQAVDNIFMVFQSGRMIVKDGKLLTDSFPAV
jgi:imidazolonepropionase-like amidohydrolase